MNIKEALRRMYSDSSKLTSEDRQSTDVDNLEAIEVIAGILDMLSRIHHSPENAPYWRDSMKSLLDRAKCIGAPKG